MKVPGTYILKTAAVVVVLFATIPLLMPSHEVTVLDENGETTAASPKNPIVRTFDRIANFYGFSGIGAGAKAQRPATDLAGESFDIYGNPITLTNNTAKLASSKNQIYTPPAGEGGAALSYTGAVRQESATQSGARHLSATETAPSKTGVEKAALTLEGKTYDVIAGGDGKKYALTERGAVDIEDFIARGAVYSGKSAALADGGPGAIVSRADFEARASSGQSGIGARPTVGGQQAGGSGVIAGSGADLSFASMSGAYADVKTQTAGRGGGTAGSGRQGDAGRAQSAGSYAQTNMAVRTPSPSVPAQSNLAENKGYMRDYYENIPKPQQGDDASALYKLLPNMTIGPNYETGIAEDEDSAPVRRNTTPARG